jgi:hypothetical protein
MYVGEACFISILQAFPQLFVEHHSDCTLVAHADSIPTNYKATRDAIINYSTRHDTSKSNHLHCYGTFCRSRYAIVVMRRDHTKTTRNSRKAPSQVVPNIASRLYQGTNHSQGHATDGILEKGQLNLVTVVQLELLLLVAEES